MKYKKRLRVVGVMGPGEGATPDLVELAESLGRQIAQRGWVLLSGGRPAGVMQAATEGAAAAGGLTIGILPDDGNGAVAQGISVAIPTGLGHARNAVNALASDVVIACGMGAGTASEVALSIKSGTPVLLLATGSAAEKFFRSLSPQVSVVESVDAAIAAIARHLTED